MGFEHTGKTISAPRETMRTVFLGTNPAGEKVLEWLRQRKDAEILEVLTKEEELSRIEELGPEIVVSSGFEHKVPEEILEVPDKGVVNLHPSFLPYNRGAHPYIWPIIENTPAGVSIHYMNEEMDAGPIIDRREVEVLPEDTSETLYYRLQEEQFQLFKENWEEIREGVEGEEQDLGKGTIHYRKELDGLCKLDSDEEVKAGELVDRLRALTFPPHKTAYFERSGEKYYVNIEVEKEG